MGGDAAKAWSARSSTKRPAVVAELSEHDRSADIGQRGKAGHDLTVWMLGERLGQVGSELVNRTADNAISTLGLVSVDLRWAWGDSQHGTGIGAGQLCRPERTPRL